MYAVCKLVGKLLRNLSITLFLHFTYAVTRKRNCLWIQIGVKYFSCAPYWWINVAGLGNAVHPLLGNFTGPSFDILWKIVPQKTLKYTIYLIPWSCWSVYFKKREILNLIVLYLLPWHLFKLNWHVQSLDRVPSKCSLVISNLLNKNGHFIEAAIEV